MALVQFPEHVTAEISAEERRGLGVLVLADDMHVQVDGRYFCTVPRGFASDGATIPRLARPWFGSWGRCGLPAILHDWLLRNRPDLTKREVDGLFLLALQSQGVADFQSVVMYLAVRTRPR